MTPSVNLNAPTPFQEWLVERLAERGWSYRDLTKRLLDRQAGGAPNTVYHWTNGLSVPRIKQEQALADVFQVEFDELHRIVQRSRDIHDMRRQERADALGRQADAELAVLDFFRQADMHSATRSGPR